MIWESRVVEFQRSARPSASVRVLCSGLALEHLELSPEGFGSGLIADGAQRHATVRADAEGRRTTEDCSELELALTGVHRPEYLTRCERRPSARRLFHPVEDLGVEVALH